MVAPEWRYRSDSAWIAGVYKEYPFLLLTQRTIYPGVFTYTVYVKRNDDAQIERPTSTTIRRG